MGDFLNTENSDGVISRFYTLISERRGCSKTAHRANDQLLHVLDDYLRPCQYHKYVLVHQPEFNITIHPLNPLLHPSNMKIFSVFKQVNSEPFYTYRKLSYISYSLQQIFVQKSFLYFGNNSGFITLKIPTVHGSNIRQAFSSCQTTLPLKEN